MEPLAPPAPAAAKTAAGPVAPSPSPFVAPSSSAPTKPSPFLPHPQPPLPAASAKDATYKAIKTRYFQSLNLGKQRSPRSSADGAGVPTPPRKPHPTATSAPISMHNTRERAISQPDVIFPQLPYKDDKHMPIPAAGAASDSYMQFAMSVPAHMVLAQSYAPAYAPSYMPNSALDARLPRDGSFDDLDEDIYGRGRSESFESSQPIAIAKHSRDGNESPKLAVSNFVDRETDNAGEERRRAAKIRSLVSSEAD